jgi:RNA polymerase sigma factor (sigma-70 family)
MDKQFLSSLSLTTATSESDFKELLTLLNTARAAFWVFAIYNDATVREKILSEIKRIIAPTPAYEWTYSPESPYPISYLERLTEEQKRERAVVFFLDLELAEDAEWKSLDYNREYFAEHPHGLIFWVTNEGRKDAALKAPHFWSQRTSVFDFSIDRSKRQIDRLYDPAVLELSDESYEDAKRELELYQKLYEEYSALPERPIEALNDLSKQIVSLRERLGLLKTSEQLRQRLLVSLDELDEESAPIAELSSDNTSSVDRTIAIREALNQLTGRERQIAFLRYASGYSHGEIAGILGISEESVKTLNYRITEKLKRLLQTAPHSNNLNAGQ